MKSIVKTPSTIKPVTDLEDRFRVEGYRPGHSPFVTIATRLVDAEACRRVRCACCRKKGMQCRPFHRGMSYRISMRCFSCGHCQEG